ncbi:hypothetical protein [Methylobacterium sp. E-045]|uniref:hypothetical protein n=1 Tax=Methylobacterium sp. E-045 TaxID=2836575 RepID=UPI001FB8D50C|nr:hypothetical protein [Methylobacterium sp. E-045]MCJ2128251.1 hypothetical protein [Methylobacterium sp. E-045]
MLEMVKIMKPVDLKLSIAWLVTAAGSSIFVAIQLFTYLNSRVSPDGGLPAIVFSPAQMLFVSAYYGCWVIPPLLALSNRTAARWSMLILGGLLVTLNTLSGVIDGIRDGYNLIAVAIIAITVPGTLSIFLSWRDIRSRSAR